jgi:hypothetical protein
MNSTKSMRCNPTFYFDLLLIKRKLIKGKYFDASSSQKQSVKQFFKALC